MFVMCCTSFAFMYKSIQKWLISYFQLGVLYLYASPACTIKRQKMHTVDCHLEARLSSDFSVRCAYLTLEQQFHSNEKISMRKNRDRFLLPLFFPCYLLFFYQIMLQPNSLSLHGGIKLTPGSGIGLTYRPAKLYWQAVRYDQAGVNYIPHSGTKNFFATGTTLLCL